LPDRERATTRVNLTTIGKQGEKGWGEETEENEEKPLCMKTGARREGARRRQIAEDH